MNARVGFFVAAALCLSSGVSAQEISVKDGVFTQVQVDKGKGVILDWCAKCHSATLLGGENDTPPLVGSKFLDNWKDKSLAEFLEKIRTTMPVDDPGKLSKGDYLASMAYILSANNFPAGPKPLPSDTKSLSLIKITP